MSFISFETQITGDKALQLQVHLFEVIMNG